MTARHIPVLLKEVISAVLASKAPCGHQRTFVDATFGAGGYTRALLDADQACKVVAVDRDRRSLHQYGVPLAEAYRGRVELVHGEFSDLPALLNGADLPPLVNGVMFDLGVSSMQIDERDRGFSFRDALDGPLDMRMNTDSSDADAADVVNSASPEHLAEILSEYGEERYAKSIASGIAHARVDKEIRTTGDLAAIVRRSVPSKYWKQRLDPATRTFQALRIFVNDELSELRQGIEHAAGMLHPGGCLAAVSYHSLEDRIVKTFIRQRQPAKTSTDSTEPFIFSNVPASQYKNKMSFTGSAVADAGGKGPEGSDTQGVVLLREGKPRLIRPTDKEIASNPRAKSGKLRVAYRE